MQTRAVPCRRGRTHRGRRRDQRRRRPRRRHDPGRSRRAGWRRPAEIEELIGLGILVPDSNDRLTETDAKRATIVRTMRDAGLPMDGLAAAFRAGTLTLEFLDTAAYGRFTTYSGETFAAASARTGVPLELVSSVRETIGGAPPKATDRLREDEQPILDWIALQHANGFRPAAILASCGPWATASGGSPNWSRSGGAPR